ncbi:alpha/beta fold hydrolase [Kineosporia babensis]|uniref:Alpha/beta hydrolase n=1 Tax=Kineosporia babensis TaxID=499548 RepID=A0A9X1SWX5_9ACTN|nr:alpha/beta hydrolase [Kineosporia babensis]MCD5315236.1 alpha/beta hydrolase [Kineosporia babensis]
MYEMPVASRAPQTTVSADGTVIAFDVHDSNGSDGPLVLIVGGATQRRLDSSSLAEALAAAGCVGVVYDRRGRGDSTDTAPYAVQREVEDIQAVIQAVRPGGPAFLAGFSSGAALALQATAASAQVSGVIPFEPPYRLPDGPPLPEGYTTTLEKFNAAGDRDGAYEFFMLKAVGLPEDMVEGMKATPMWAHFTAVAPTLAYDGHCLGGDDHSLPTDLAQQLTVPLLGLASTGSPAYLQEPARHLAALAPHGTFELLDGEFHTAPDSVIAARVAAFTQAVNG